MVDFLTGPVPTWLFLTPLALLIVGGIAAILLIKEPDYHDHPPHP